MKNKHQHEDFILLFKAIPSNRVERKNSLTKSDEFLKTIVIHKVFQNSIYV